VSRLQTQRSISWHCDLDWTERRSLQQWLCSRVFSVSTMKDTWPVRMLLQQCTNVVQLCQTLWRTWPNVE